jgi:Cu2+-exporting ATPase
MRAVLAAESAADAAAGAACFHCGLPLAHGAWPVMIDGVSRDTCCRGCQAVARSIVELGLGSYYRNRAAPPRTAKEARAALDDLGLYDLPEIQRGFVREVDAGRHQAEAALLLDGITCAACVWLIEQRLARLPGVLEAGINYATRRARVRWDRRAAQLSAILRAIAELGYGAQPYDAARSEDALKRERRTMLWRLFVAGFGMMQVMMYAVPAYVTDGQMTADIDQLMRLASLALTVPVALWSALPFYAGAWRDLRNRRIGMDVPVSLGILIAFAASVLATLQGAGTVYFDSVTMFVFLLLGARYLEMCARAKAAESQERLARLAPAVAERLDRYPQTSRQTTVAVATLRPGDHVMVRPGAAVPADGIVAEGASAVDESLLTGESRPVAKKAGDGLTAGAVNRHGPLVMRVDRVGEDTVLSSIVRLMDRAQSAKPRIAETADIVARWFVAALLLFTAVIAAVWLLIDPSRALWVAVALLVVTCPCALSLATPAALAAGNGALYRAGVLVTRGHALETLARATHFVFDKTGTLTQGRMRLLGVMPLAGVGQARCLALAAALEARSEHPVAKAIAAELPAGAPPAKGLRNVPGMGIEGEVEGRLLRIGAPAFVAELVRQPLPDELLLVSEEASVVALGGEEGWLALLTVGDMLRPDARRVVGALAAQGKTVCLLSGDRSARVQRLARELGITQARGDADPREKLRFVRALQAQGAVVAMTGDGVNDAPVLAQAQVSIAMGSGTDLARTGADLLLRPDRLEPLLEAVTTARRTLRIIRQNLAWAVAYNAVALPLAALGQVTPLIAAAGMSLSSLTVVLNALRLARAASPGHAHERAPAAQAKAWKSSTC